MCERKGRKGWTGHAAPDTSYLPITDDPAGLSLTISTWDFINGWQQTTAPVHADADGYYPY